MSHETIYRSPYVQTRGVVKQQLMAHLRSQRIMRRSGARSFPRLGSMSSRPSDVRSIRLSRRQVPTSGNLELELGILAHPASASAKTAKDARAIIGGALLRDSGIANAG